MKNNTEQQEQIMVFDESEFFLKEIAPKMEEILKQCHERGIPILMCAIHQHTKKGYKLENMSAINNRNGQAVHDLSNCSKILSSPPSIAKSIALQIMAEKIKE
jgi:hypothetical protein